MKMLPFAFLVLVATCVSVSSYVISPSVPNALYQEWMNVSFVSGRLNYFAETAGFASSGVYNGVLGITFDKTESYGFLTSADGKKVRKLSLKTTQVGLDVTSAHSWHYPMGLVFDSSNTKLYVGDRHLISIVNVDNTNQVLFNETYSVSDICGDIAFGNVEGNGTFSRLYEPRFVIIDSSDTYLYVTEALNFQIRRIDLSSAPLYNSLVYVKFGSGTAFETNGIAMSNAGDYIYAVATALNGLWKIPVSASLPVLLSQCTFFEYPHWR